MSKLGQRKPLQRKVVFPVWKTHIKTPSILLRAFFAILNLLARDFSLLKTYLLMKSSMSLLRGSYSGVTATRVKMFQTFLSGNSNMASNSIRKCIILFGDRFLGSISSTAFKTARERLKDSIILAVNFAKCIDLINGIDSSSLK